MSRFWSDESGATAVEVGIIVALITVALVTAVTLLGNNVKAVFTKASNAAGT